MNPGRLLLLIGGVFAVLVGVRGSQSSVFAAITGKGLPASSSTSPSSAAPGSQLKAQGWL